MSYYGGSKGPWQEYLELSSYSGNEQRYASIVQALAALPESQIFDEAHCVFCEETELFLGETPHTNDCLWVRARREFPQDPAVAEAKNRRELARAFYLLGNDEMAEEFGGVS